MKTVRQLLEAKGRNIYSVAPDTIIYDALKLMAGKRIRHLPVVEDSVVIGVLSIGDLVKETIAYQEFLIRQLESYIQS